MRTTIVYAPHPDDETLYLSGYVRAAALRGDRLVLVAVTDGGASGAKPDDWSVDYLMSVRRKEQATAWAALTQGATRPATFRLDQPDGAISSAKVTTMAKALESIYATDVEHYVAGSYLTDESADHRAVANGVKNAGVRVARFARDPRKTGGGSVYKPADTQQCLIADNAYEPFGWTSVPSAFEALRTSGYSSRIFP